VDPAGILGPAADRLSRTFRSRAEYESFWKAHPAFENDWSAEIAEYVAYDLDGEAPHLKPSTAIAAMAENVLQLDGSNGYAEALAGLTLPIDFLRAPRGLLNDEGDSTLR
jgi:lipase